MRSCGDGTARTVWFLRYLTKLIKVNERRGRAGFGALSCAILMCACW